MSEVLDRRYRVAWYIQPFFEFLSSDGDLVITFQRGISFSGHTGDLPSVQVTLEVPRLTFRASDDIDKAVGHTGRVGHVPASDRRNTYRVTVAGGLVAVDSSGTFGAARRPR